LLLLLSYSFPVGCDPGILKSSGTPGKMSVTPTGIGAGNPAVGGNRAGPRVSPTPIPENGIGSSFHLSPDPSPLPESWSRHGDLNPRPADYETGEREIGKDAWLKNFPIILTK
jgi:hypothetical protein